MNTWDTWVLDIGDVSNQIISLSLKQVTKISQKRGKTHLCNRKKSPRLPGAGRSKAWWHHHGSDMPTSPRVIYVLKSAKRQNVFWGGVLELMAYG